MADPPLLDYNQYGDVVDTDPTNVLIAYSHCNAFHTYTNSWNTFAVVYNRKIGMTGNEN